ncbi:MAG: alpha/beta hydrolase [Jatrophihabitans sp.]
MARVSRTVQRSALGAADLYARGLGARGRMSNAEVHGMRALLELQLSRPAFRPDHETTVTPVRERRPDGQVRGEWVERPGISTRGTSVLLYVHGGGFVAGSPRSHRGLTAELGRRLGRSVFSLDYRLAPGHRFPAAADDVLRAYAWLLDSGVAAQRIIVAGDSAGGHLVLGLSPRALRAGLPVPGGVIAFSPLVDPSMALSADWERAHGRGRIVGARAGRAAIGRYHPGVKADHPELLLTNDDLHGLPPTLIQASASEILVADAEHYVAAARGAGGRVELQTWPRQTHVFQVAFRISRSADAALGRVVEFVDEVSPTHS